MYPITFSFEMPDEIEMLAGGRTTEFDDVWWIGVCDHSRTYDDGEIRTIYTVLNCDIRHMWE